MVTIKKNLPPTNELLFRKIELTRNTMTSETTAQRHFAKNRESGIWLKISKIIAIPETEILHSRSLPIFPDNSQSEKK
jgi:hypothetical protein